MKNEKKVPYNLRLPRPLKTKLEKQARDEKRSLNQHIIFVLERFGMQGVPNEAR